MCHLFNMNTLCNVLTERIYISSSSHNKPVSSLNTISRLVFTIHTHPSVWGKNRTFVMYRVYQQESAILREVP